MLINADWVGLWINTRILIGIGPNWWAFGIGHWSRRSWLVENNVDWKCPTFLVILVCKPTRRKVSIYCFSCFARKHTKRTFCWQLEKQHVIGLTPTQYILKETALSIGGHYLIWLRTDYPRTMPVIGDILTPGLLASYSHIHIQIFGEIINNLGK